MDSYSKLLRRCDHATNRRNEAQCLFYTLGGKQVDRGAILGWKDVLSPALQEIRLWPFDGDLPQLLQKPGLDHTRDLPWRGILAPRNYDGTGRCKGKRNRSHRQEVSGRLIEACSDAAKITDAAKSWIEWGFLDEDDFDATVGVLSMLQVVVGKRPSAIPETKAVCELEGWNSLVRKPVERESL